MSFKDSKILPDIYTWGVPSDFRLTNPQQKIELLFIPMKVV